MKALMCVLLFFTTLLTVSGQTGKAPLQGRILSAGTQHPVEGARIDDINGLHITVTDNKGYFNIAAREYPVSLKISSMGHRDTVVVFDPTQQPFTVYLQEIINQLQEVNIQTGYQTLKPNEVTGAVEVVSKETLNQQTGTNILQRLNNVTAGIRFDNQPIVSPDRQKLNVSVRGLSTINGNLDPLVVLDGFIYEGDINNIDPNSIESVTILKDAAASSIWGARAGNGVIVITSKKGAFSVDSPTSVSFNSTMIWRNKPDLHQIYQLDNADFIKTEEMLYHNGYYDWIVKGLDYMAVTPAIDIFDRRCLGLITASDSAAAIQNLLLQDGRAAYADNFYTTPFSNQYSLNLTGGAQRNTYGLSVGYTGARNENSVRDRKINLQLTNSYRPTDKLQIDLNVLYTRADNESGTPAYESLSFNGKRVPYLQFTDQIGGEIPFFMDYRQLVLEDRYASGFQGWAYYPLSDYRNAKINAVRNELYATVAVRYKLLRMLDLNTSVQYQQQTVDQINLYQQDSHYARRYINQFTEVDPNTGAVKYNVPVGGIKDQDNARVSSYTARSQLNLNETRGDHRIVGIVGAEIRQILTEGNSFTAYGYNDDPLRTAPVDHVKTFRINPTNQARTITGHPLYSRRINRFVSLYGNGSYIFKNRYALSGSIRRDGGNIFGAATNDKWSPLWSIGGSWDAANEEFLKWEFMDRLKFRTTFGYSGNVDLRKTPDPVASITTGTYTLFPALTIGTINDPELRWEKISTLNFGLDFSVFNGRISGSFDHYIKDGRDLYGLTAFDYTAWGRQSTVTKNVGRMEGRGWDITLNVKNIDRVFKWDTRYILNLNRNKTVEYYNTVNSGVSSFLSNGNTITPIVGMPLNALAGFRWLGLNEEGDPMGMLDGAPSTNYIGINTQSLYEGEDSGSIVFYGSAKPQIFGSMINSFGWKDFSFTFNVSFRGNYYFRKPVTSYTSLFSNGTVYPDFEERWQAPGDENSTDVPGMQYPLKSNRDSFYGQAEINIHRADHLRLEYITASWHKGLMLGGKQINSRLYGNVANLGLLWTANKKGIDPEFAYRLTPPTTFSLGIQIDY
ncbi:SusC/RagA family TonB-linked outer membrane protein [Sphingobacterium alkalisoli]|uniref:SusC/RagA family TonB-linked outer membrane protein n=1 Tax=Sphingobacterium alkalisoli TaxID=1874115 RepID=A0A4U0H2G1_9SPHI|nr:SusC/RagA family TonB-linked outer membrane protein [Sphingobacterium alkalisoli]TJY65813.1 SusC/RagA family TonB-linked outer membrane protein [Sphingobacterium alkalisoli]GGH18165.1 SusC/RagA family TonB-linked outer membrane protein [Sphingobacterium alkalisoli]